MPSCFCSQRHCKQRLSASLVGPESWGTPDKCLPFSILHLFLSPQLENVVGLQYLLLILRS